MDPSGLAGPEWSDIGKLLTYMWIVVALVASFATNMLVGHALIPSLVGTFHLPAFLQRTRPIFYGAAVLSLGLAVFMLVQVIGLSDVLERFWDDYWI